MTALVALTSRVRRLPPARQDALLAAIVSAGMVVESGVQLDRSVRPALTIVLVLLIGASLAWRRRAPAVSTVSALIGLGLFVRFSEVPDWTLPLLVIALDFFTVGAADYSRRRLLATGGLLLGGLFVVVAIDPQDAVSGGLALLANTALFGLLPLAVGRALRNRQLLAAQLRARTAQLQRDRDERTRQAGVDERTRIARELHDVVAHSVSVMVIQAQGAQRLAAVDPHLAVEALEAIQSSGRDALREMRGMIGVMRGSDANVEAATPGLAQLPTLADRARAAGMQVELQLPQEQLELSPGLDLIAYRFVQEGLTNAIKHAGPAHAIVSVRCTDERLELEVCDDGGSGTVADTTGAGQGLAGMAERLAVYGGELESGRRPEGGFYVRASTALDAAPRLSEPAVAVAQPAQRPEGHRLAIRYGRYLEIVLALCVAATSAADLIFSRHRQGSVLLNLLIAGLLGGCVFLRRQHALLYATATIGLAVVCTAGLTDVRTYPLVIWLIVLPPYALARYEDLTRGLAGVAILIAGAAVVNVVAARPATAGDLVFPIAVIVCTWAIGRALRSGQALAVELKRGNRRLAAEREHRVRLAVADERTRIARELHLVVANSVSDMVVEAELAQRLVDQDLAAATDAMSVIETTGRAALVEMRGILSVLRGGDGAQLEPQPGLGALPGLVEQARHRGRLVELTVAGEPGPLPTSVELAAYRLVEEALTNSSEAGDPRTLLQILFEFREHDLLVVVTDSGARTPAVTVAMRERVALCNGELNEGSGADGGQELRVTLPTDYPTVFA